MGSVTTRLTFYGLSYQRPQITAVDPSYHARRTLLPWISHTLRFVTGRWLSTGNSHVRYDEVALLVLLSLSLSRCDVVILLEIVGLLDTLGWV